MIAAPTAAKLITSAMICRWLDVRSRYKRLPDTDTFLFRTGGDRLWRGLCLASAERSSTRSPEQAIISVPLINSMLFVPIRSVKRIRISEPAIPPSAAPPPMKPKIRLACRGS